jgi:hypothetical protein
MTIEEALLQTGMTKEQIAALDPKLVTTFTTILTSAESDKTAGAQAAAKAEADRIAWEKAKADAELLQRSNTEFYETKIVPGLTSWQAEQVQLQTDKANAEALAAFYKTQNDAARTAGFVPTDAPTFTPPVKTPPVADPTRTPGTPTFTIDEVKNGLGNTLGTITDIQWKHRQLYGGKEMPISPTELIRQSEANKFKDPGTYAAHIFKFAEREEELRQAAAKAHDDAIRAEVAAAKDAERKAELDKIQAEFAAEKKKIAEGQGSNPDTRTPPGSSKFTELRRQVEAKERPDPTRMSAQERMKLTRDNIHKAIEERETAVA